VHDPALSGASAQASDDAELCGKPILVDIKLIALGATSASLNLVVKI
jgi:hypothetical protein